MEESIGSEGLEFKWGKKKSVGGRNKDVQFYESFTYDGDEYHLYDCVLVGNSSEPDSTEPFVGKIIKIWEHANKHIPRKVKLLWFFRPSEILPYLEGVPDVLANELFLASGEGRGLANINELQSVENALFYASQRTKEIHNPRMKISTHRTSFFAEHLMLEAAKLWIR